MLCRTVDGFTAVAAVIHRVAGPCRRLIPCCQALSAAVCLLQPLLLLACLRERHAAVSVATACVGVGRAGAGGAVVAAGRAALCSLGLSAA